jgi:DNA-binding transcriptional regulator YhcF (GntR family)
MINIYYIIFLLFIIAILVIFGVWNSNIHKNPKYRSLLSLLGALTIMFSSFAIILQVYTFNASQADSQIQIYEQMFDDLFAVISTYFETNPKLNYYYNEMFHPLNYNQSSIEQRLYTEEMQVTTSILQKIASIVYFIENDKTLSPSESKDIEEKLDKLIRNMVNSHIFVENYQNIKLNFVSESLSNYMHKHYNI